MKQYTDEQLNQALNKAQQAGDKKAVEHIQGLMSSAKSKYTPDQLNKALANATAAGDRKAVAHIQSLIGDAKPETASLSEFRRESQNQRGKRLPPENIDRQSSVSGVNREAYGNQPTVTEFISKADESSGGIGEGPELEQFAKGAYHTAKSTVQKAASGVAKGIQELADPQVNLVKKVGETESGEPVFFNPEELSLLGKDNQAEAVRKQEEQANKRLKEEGIDLLRSSVSQIAAGVGESIDRSAEQSDLEVQRNRPGYVEGQDTPASGASFLYDVTTGLTQMLSSVAVSRLTSNPTAGLLTLADQVALSTFSEKVNEGMSVDQAAKESLLQAAYETVPEKMFGVFDRVLQPGALNRVKQLFAEGGSESVTEAFNIIDEGLRKGEDVGTVEDVIGRLAYAASVGGFMGLFLGRNASSSEYIASQIERQGGVTPSQISEQEIEDQGDISLDDINQAQGIDTTDGIQESVVEQDLASEAVNVDQVTEPDLELQETESNSIVSETKQVEVDGKKASFAVIRPSRLQVDTEAYQYKQEGAKKPDQKYDSENSGKYIVHRRQDGDFVVDGHGRREAAIEAEKKGRNPDNITGVAIILNESDGWTTEDVKNLGVVKNITEGTSTVEDTVRAIQENPQLIEELSPFVESNNNWNKAIEIFNSGVTNETLKPDENIGDSQFSPEPQERQTEQDKNVQKGVRQENVEDVSSQKIKTSDRTEWIDKGTKSSVFSRWYKNSKLKDEKGDPVPYYHGTSSVFDNFSISKSTDSQGGKFNVGLGPGKIYLSSSPSVASSYASSSAKRNKSGNPNVKKVYVNSVNPITEEEYGSIYKKISGGKELYDSETESSEREKFLRQTDSIVKEKGYDSIITPNGQLAVFDPSIIKSATGSDIVEQYDGSTVNVSGTDKSVVEKWVSEFTQEKGLVSDISIVQAEKDLPKKILDQASRRGFKGKIQGVFYKGKAYVVADSISDKKGFQKLLLHEITGHHKLREVFGDKLNSVLDGIWKKHHATGLREIIKTYFPTNGRKFDSDNLDHKREVAEEYLANLAEKDPSSSFVKKAVKEISAFLSNKGFKGNLNDAYIIDILRGKSDYLVSPATAEPSYTLPSWENAVKKGDGVEIPNKVDEDSAVYFSLDEEKTKSNALSRAIIQTIRGLSILPDVSNSSIDTILSSALRIMGGLDVQGRWKPGVVTAKGIEKYLKEWRPKNTKGIPGFVGDTLDFFRAGLIDRWGQSEDYIKRSREQEREKDSILTVLRGILEGLQSSGITHKEAIVIQNLLEGKEVNTEELGKIAEPIRKSIDDLGFELVKLGLLDSETWRKGLGKYLHRSYVKHESDLNGLPRLAERFFASRRRGVWGDEFKARGIKEKLTISQIEENMPKEWWDTRKKQGTIDDAIRNETWIPLEQVVESKSGKVNEDGTARRYVKKRIWWPKSRPIPKIYKDWERGRPFEFFGTTQGKVVLRRDFTEEELKRMGKVMDARFNIIRTFQMMSHDIANGRFYKDIAENETWSTDKPAEGDIVAEGQESRLATVLTHDWVRVPDASIAGSGAKKWGALAGKYVRPEIWRDLNEMDKMSRPSFWNSALAHFKINKTARSVVVHTNNVMSNITIMDLLDVKFVDLVDAIDEFANVGQMHLEAQEAGAYGGMFVNEELNRNFIKPVLDQIRREMKLTGQTDNQPLMISKYTEILWNAVKKVDSAALHAYQVEDTIFRLAAYIKYRKLGVSKSEAAQIAVDGFLNYDIRAPWINAARRSVLPFLSYTYRAVPNIAAAIAYRPWKLAKYIMLGYLWNLFAYSMDDDSDEDLERGTMRRKVGGMTWMSIPGTDIGVHRMMRLPMRDIHDQALFLDVMRWMPAGDVFDTQQTNLGLPAWLQVSGPLQIGFELYLNRSAFTKQDIVDEELSKLDDSSIPAWRKRADFLWKSYAPGAFFVPGTWHFEKISSSIRGSEDMLGRQYTVTNASLSAIGVKVYPHDPELQMIYKSWEIERLQRALESSRNSLEVKHIRNRISDSEYEEQLEIFNRRLENLKSLAEEEFDQ